MSSKKNSQIRAALPVFLKFLSLGGFVAKHGTIRTIVTNLLLGFLYCIFPLVTSSMGVLLMTRLSMREGGRARDRRMSSSESPLSHTIETDSNLEEMQLQGSCKRRHWLIIEGISFID